MQKGFRKSGLERRGGLWSGNCGKKDLICFRWMVFGQGNCGEKDLICFRWMVFGQGELWRERLLFF